MKEIVGEVFSIAKDNTPVTGCTISKEVHGGENGIIYFSLARNTDISGEIFPYHKLLIVADGSLEVYGPDGYLFVLLWQNTVLFSSQQRKISKQLQIRHGLMLKFKPFLTCGNILFRHKGIVGTVQRLDHVERKILQS